MLILTHIFHDLSHVTIILILTLHLIVHLCSLLTAGVASEGRAEYSAPARVRPTGQAPFARCLRIKTIFRTGKSMRNGYSREFCLECLHFSY